MKLLKIKASGLPIFNNELDIDFTANAKVYDKDKDYVTNIFNNIYINNTVSFVGINASGKTSILRLILFVIRFLNNEQINNIQEAIVLNNFEKANLDLFYSRDNNTVNRLKVVLKTEKTNDGKFIHNIVDETIWSKKLTANSSKKSIFEFRDTDIYETREKGDFYLQEDCSIIIKQNKVCGDKFVGTSTIGTNSMPSASMLQITNYNENLLKKVVKFFDPTIEIFQINTTPNGQSYLLKYYDSMPIHIANHFELNYLLSSGTLKGIPLFIELFKIFEVGGYLFVDELENHFNKEIALSLIRFFNDPKINKKGAVLLFSTHYPEILDELPRNDCINILNNNSNISLINLSKVLKRNDIKKSEAFMYGYTPNTMPQYESFKQVQKALRKINA